MPESTTIRPEFAEAVESEDWDRIEELWLESLDRRPVPAGELFEVRRRIWKSGRKNLALTLLELLADTLDDTGPATDALIASRELLRLSGAKASPELKQRLLDNLRAARADNPSLNDVLERHPIGDARRPLEELDAVECWLDHDLGTVVEVIGKGVGRVVDLNLKLDNVKVDVGTGRPMSIPFGAVRKHLRPLPQGDIRRRMVEDREAVSELVEAQPGDALVEVLESLGQQSDVAAIKAALEPVLPASRWSSWWAKARKHPRVISSGSGSRLTYTVTESAEDAVDALLEDLEAAEPAARLPIVRRLADRGPEVAAHTGRILAASLDGLAGQDPGLAWQTAGALANLPDGAEPAAACRRRLLSETEPLALLSGISDRVSRSEALQEIAGHRDDEWPRVWAEWLLHEDSPQVLDAVARRLDREGYGGLVDGSMEAVFRNHLQHPAQFIWACEKMTEDDAPDALHQRMTPSLLEKLPETLTRAEFAPFRNRAKGLLDGGKVAIRLLMESASSQQADRFSQRIARLDTVEPQRLKLIEQAATHQRPATTEVSAPILAASKQAVDAKREELRVLVEEEIPKTLKGINAAAAEGDLRENFEYHMLRDRQELQSARAAKLQEELTAVRILEPGAADISTVNIGTVVHLAGENGKVLDPITILGAWDADLERRILANGSELAQRMIGKSTGDTVEIDDGSAVITRIEAWTG
jgi:transcription elongation factor GreA